MALLSRGYSPIMDVPPRLWWAGWPAPPCDLDSSGLVPGRVRCLGRLWVSGWKVRHFRASCSSLCKGKPKPALRISAFPDWETCQ